MNFRVVQNYLIRSVATALFVASTLAAQAASLIVGAPADSNLGNCFPFGCGERYQQAYASSLFSGPISITGLTFFNTQALAGTIDPATYTITLSSGGGSVGSLSTVFANNIGANVQTFFSGALGGSAFPSFSISGTAFTYDPASGDLLLDVSKSIGSTIGNGTVFNDTRQTFTGFQRVFSEDSQTDGSSDLTTGLVTQFEFTVAAAETPLPAALPLFVSGLGALGLLGWRRTRRAIAA